MMHALAIGHAGPDAVAAVDGLWSAGYRSIMRVEDTQDAAAVLACFHPDLILVLPDITHPDSMTVLRGIAKQAHAPVIVARADMERALDCLGPVVSSERVRWSSPQPVARVPLAA